MQGEEAFDRLSADERAALADAIIPPLTGFADGSKLDVAGEVRFFIDRYGDRPARDNKGGCRFNSCVSIHLVARMTAPDLIIESGSFQGQSAWVLRQARPDAEIRCYDIDLSNLVYRSDGISFAERDWTEDDQAADGRTLIFFDDHVSHARRIVEAHARGFRTLLLDDDVTAGELGITGVPPAPTVSMLDDDALPWGETITWTRKGRPQSLRLDVAERDAALALIASVRPLPDLQPINGWPSNRRLRLVELVP